MAVWVDTSQIHKTHELVAHVLYAARDGERVQFLVQAGTAAVIAQRMRVALSRSRTKNRNLGKKVKEFVLMCESYPFTKDGKRYDCIVMWTEQSIHHRKRELLDDLVERIEHE